jgi:dTDP-4-dehydrorhamnose reductase
MALKVLLTGSNGLLGQKIIDLAPDFGIDLLATSKGLNRYKGKNNHVSFASVDLTNASEIKSIILEFKPDVVIHGAAMTQVDQCELDPTACQLANVEATRFVVEACKLVNAFLVFVSTDFVFDGEDGPYDETATPNPLSIYGQSKWDAERLIMQSGIKSAILRTILVYGITPGEARSNFALWAQTNLKAGKSIQVVTDQFRSPTLAEDLAIACLKAAEIQAEGLFHIGGPETKSIYDWVIEVAEFWNLDKSLITPADGTIFTQPAKRPHKTGFIIIKANKILGFYPRTFKEGLALIDAQALILP